MRARRGRPGRDPAVATAPDVIRSTAAAGRPGARTSRRRTIVLALVILAVSTACGAPAATGPAMTEAVVAGERRRMPEAPLAARGGARAVWTGAELLVLGGSSTDGEVPPCPPTADCIGPPSTTHLDGAAFNPVARSWRYLPATGSCVPDVLRWTGRVAIGRSAALASG